MSGIKREKSNYSAFSNFLKENLKFLYSCAIACKSSGYIFPDVFKFFPDYFL